LSLNWNIEINKNTQLLTRENFISSPVSIKAELLGLFKQKDPLTIFDIGACEAEDSIRYASLFPNATVYAFEPRADNCKKAIELITQYKKKNIVLENIALSNQNGKAEFYLSEGQPEEFKTTGTWDYGNKSSSLLPPSDEKNSNSSWLKFNKKMEVETIRLADYVQKKGIHTIDYAHIDVQGAELMVLEGAGGFLKKIKLIWLEVEAIELYKNQPLKNEVEFFMGENNFINILDTVDSVDGDQLYANKMYFSESALKAIPKVRKKKYSFISRVKSFLKS